MRAHGLRGVGVGGGFLVAHLMSSLDRVNAGTVALIAQGILERKVQFGHLEAQDFSSLKPYGTGCATFREKAHEDACIEAWALVKKAEETRPQD
jgi:hypothetical protein